MGCFCIVLTGGIYLLLVFLFFKKAVLSHISIVIWIYSIPFLFSVLWHEIWDIMNPMIEFTRQSQIFRVISITFFLFILFGANLFLFLAWNSRVISWSQEFECCGYFIYLFFCSMFGNFHSKLRFWAVEFGLVSWCGKTKSEQNDV